MQTDEVLRTYPEYAEGVADKGIGANPNPEKYPLISSGGAFEKKAYLLGYMEG